MNHEFIIQVSCTDYRIDKYKVSVDGLFMYKDNKSLKESIENFIIDFVNKRQEFDECYGAYRILIDQEWKKIYFSDNSGMMRFYINKRENRFFKSLMEAEKDTTNRTPNYSAIAQFLCYGCVYGNETIVSSVILSNPNMYYEVYKGEIIKKSKSLQPMQAYSKTGISLNNLVIQAVSHCEGKVGCTITGGIDSRSVLANLIDIGVNPLLAITGNNTQSDVQIAKKIAKKTDLNLLIVSDEIEEENWLDLSIEAADGQDGICGIYRLKKLAIELQNRSVDLQFGGLAGEMYKNSFINQDFPFYFGKPKWKKFYRYKVGTFDFREDLFGENVEKEIEKLPSIMLRWLEKFNGSCKGDAYLNAGYEIMQFRCQSNINMFEKHITIYNPLMERKMASYAFGRNPYKLEMQTFQRQEVSEHCRGIKSIETDRNLTCDYYKRNEEFIKNYLFLIKVTVQRLFFRNKVDIRIDNCFEEGHKTEDFYKAINYTKMMGVLNNEIKIEDVPVGLRDRLFTIGSFFE